MAGSVADRLRRLRTFELLIFALMFVLFAISLSVLPVVAGDSRVAVSFPGL
jgi:hypothetical protein